MSEGNEVSADAEWIDLFKAKLSKHGARKQLADMLDVHPSMVSRMAGGGSVHPGHLYRASVLLGIRSPTTLPLDDLQQRLLYALMEVREVLAMEQAEKLVAAFEEKVAAIHSAVEDAASVLSGNEDEDRTALAGMITDIEKVSGRMKSGEKVFAKTPGLTIQPKTKK